MKDILLLTGPTGALGGPLIEALSSLDSIERIYVLARGPDAEFSIANVEVVTGDVTRQDLCGLPPHRADEVLAETTAILHGAACTRFDSPLDLARRVNVQGTRNVLALAARCRRLNRFGFLSTCYVAGKRCGSILEPELAHASGFVNAYEQSKYEAEEVVRAAANEFPIAIYRLSTILGDSRSGFVRKLAAIHQAIRLCYCSLMPMIPGTSVSSVDLIASDYAASALRELFCQRFQAGRTYQICGGADSLPLQDFLEALISSFLRFRPAWRKRAIAKPALVGLATFEWFARSVEEIGDSALAEGVGALKYFAPQLAFAKQLDDTECTLALAGSNVVRPSLREFFPKAVRWLMENRWGAPRVSERELVPA